ncbi:HMT3 methyltransferase, partial [Polypterus senegalus]
MQYKMSCPFVKNQEFKNWHRQQIQCLVSAGVDLLAMETIPSQKEAEALVDLLKEFPDTRAWLSYSCKDEQCISHGERFADAVKVASRSKQLIAIGLNCCSPASVSPLLASAVKPPDLAWIVYPNSGEEWDVDSGATVKIVILIAFSPLWALIFLAAFGIAHFTLIPLHQTILTPLVLEDSSKSQLVAA